MINKILLPFTISILFSGSYIAAKYTIIDLGPLTTTFLRYFVALFFLFCLLPYFKLSSLKINKKDLVKIICLGIFGIIGYHYLFFISLKYTDIANTAIINSLSPLTTASFAAIFLGERLKKSNYFGVLLAFAGVAILITRGSYDVIIYFKFNKGDILMIFAMTSWVIYTLLIKKLIDTYSGFTLTFYSMLFGVIILIPLVTSENIVAQIQTISPASMLSVIYMGICASGLGYLLFNLSVKQFGPTRTTSFVYSLVPVLVAVLALLFFQQAITLIILISTVLIITGLRFVLWGKE